MTDAYELGYRANCQAFRRNENPFWPLGELRYQWFCGWDAAAAERCERIFS